MRATVVLIVLLFLCRPGATVAQTPREVQDQAKVCSTYGSDGFLQVATRLTPPNPRDETYLQIGPQCWWEYNPVYRISAFPNGEVTYYFCNACGTAVTFGFQNIGSAQVLTSCRSADLVNGQTITVQPGRYSDPQVCSTGAAFGAFTNYDIYASMSGGKKVNIDPQIVLDRSGRGWVRLAEIGVAAGSKVAVIGAVQGEWVDGLRDQGAAIVVARSDSKPDVLLIGGSTAEELTSTVQRLGLPALDLPVVWIIRPGNVPRAAALPIMLEYESDDEKLSTGFVAARVRIKRVQQ